MTTKTQDHKPRTGPGPDRQDSNGIHGISSRSGAPLEVCEICAAFYCSYFGPLEPTEYKHYPSHAYLKVILGTAVSTICTRLFGVLPDNEDGENPALIHSSHYHFSAPQPDELVRQAIKTALQEGARKGIRTVEVFINHDAIGSDFSDIHYDLEPGGWQSLDEASYWREHSNVTDWATSAASAGEGR